MGTLLAMVLSIMMSGCGHTAKASPVVHITHTVPVEDLVDERSNPPDDGDKQTPVVIGPGTGKTSRSSAPRSRSRPPKGAGKNTRKKKWVPEPVPPRPYLNTGAHIRPLSSW
jgi:hypothetical protein